MLDEFDYLAASGDKAADRGEGLAEGPHYNIDIILDAKMFGGPTATVAQDADGVSFIHIYSGPEPAGERNYFCKIRSVAFHRKNAIDNYNASLVRREACENLLQVNHIVMAEPERAGEGGQAPVKDRSMNIAVGDYDIAFLGDGRESAEVS